jgi:hypothetical protein
MIDNLFLSENDKRYLKFKKAEARRRKKLKKIEAKNEKQT